ncbi:hypothetical protein STEG23_023480 [Scotinomys teguina]
MPRPPDWSIGPQDAKATRLGIGPPGCQEPPDWSISPPRMPRSRLEHQSPRMPRPPDWSIGSPGCQGPPMEHRSPGCPPTGASVPPVPLGISPPGCQGPLTGASVPPGWPPEAQDAPRLYPVAGSAGSCSFATLALETFEETVFPRYPGKSF